MIHPTADLIEGRCSHINHSFRPPPPSFSTTDTRTTQKIDFGKPSTLGLKQPEKSAVLGVAKNINSILTHQR